MANAHRNVPAQWDFAKTGRMSTIAFVVAAVLLAIVVLLTVAFMSSRASESGKPLQQGVPVTR